MKPALKRLCREDCELLTEFNVAMYYEKACKELEETARKKGTSILFTGFKLAGIVPFNSEATAAGTAAADARLAPTPAQLARAKEVGKAAGKLLAAEAHDVVTASFTGRVPEVVVALQPLSDKAEQMRKAKFRAEEKDDNGAMNYEDKALAFVGRVCPTSKTYAQMRERQEAAKAQEEQEKAERAQVKAEGKVRREMEEKERKAKWEATLAERAAKKAAKEAEVAARVAAKAARVPVKVTKAGKVQPQAAAAPLAGKRAKQAEENPYGRAYKNTRDKS